MGVFPYGPFGEALGECGLSGLKDMFHVLDHLVILYRSAESEEASTS